jgi:hypothetical protein
MTSLLRPTLLSTYDDSNGVDELTAWRDRCHAAELPPSIALPAVDNPLGRLTVLGGARDLAALAVVGVAFLALCGLVALGVVLVAAWWRVASLSGGAK